MSGGQPVPLLLALDTSTSVASVALFDGSRVLSETTWVAGREHSTRLLVEVQTALARVGRGIADVTGVVVARGPGSFTGVRVALSVAKGIAAGRGVPLWGISSLDVVAAAAGPTRVPVRALVEAGRGRIATALYRDGASVEPASLMTVDQLTADFTEPTLLLGDIPERARAALTAQPNAMLASPAASLRRAGHLAELGWRLAQAGDAGNAAAVDALYLS
ncbi:MAG: tRNA (adenosine(37)-N6)-threonylcarbamoyltransferase complex dimerization subunit type 1 TsaB [Chloroflexota bacterium]